MAECIEKNCKRPRVENSKYCQKHLPSNQEITTYNVSCMDSSDSILSEIIQKEMTNSQEDN